MIKSRDNLSLSLFPEDISENKIEQESLKDKETKYYDRVREILDKVIIDLASEDPGSEISMGAIFTRYNDELEYAEFKIDAQDQKALEIISKKLKEVERIKSAKNVDSHIKDIKRIKADKNKPGTLKERPIKDFPTFTERSFPKENQ